MDELGPKPTVLDPCLFYDCENDAKESLKGVQATLVDDTLGTGTDGFSQSEEKIGERF